MEPPNFFATMTTEVINNHLWLRNHLPTSSPATAVTTFPSSKPHLARVPREAPTNTPAIISPEEG
ncbi:unnamed protein product [Cyprideis torosa]|uniref:Uncharacterized protein n=1 Tax=Cyprideis torosa TaxID=163714 RepID=A0A7R8ZWF3_9CRUS|nr:unnamed protein product [Cyprideis torosa]CAG0911656.1 unnamed protein product [Cyprideis torosa]